MISIYAVPGHVLLLFATRFRINTKTPHPIPDLLFSTNIMTTPAPTVTDAMKLYLVEYYSSLVPGKFQKVARLILFLRGVEGNFSSVVRPPTQKLSIP